MMAGTLYLVPSGLGASDVAATLPAATLAVVHRLQCFVVENPKTARAFLKSIGFPRPLQGVRFETLDVHTPPSMVPSLLHPLEEGLDVGLLPEAGCPGIADPGANLVAAAHEAGIRVVPLVGPSAILLALVAAGFNGQRFSFWGYLPVAAEARRKRILQLEAAAWRDDVTQAFIETPYRNGALFDAIVDVCRPETRLCVATELTSPGEAVRTQSVGRWRTARPDLNRRPTVFLLYRGVS